MFLQKSRYLVRKLVECFRFHDPALIHLEGGLGSQILGLIAFENLRESIGEQSAKCNLEYFTKGTSADLRPWALSNYGVQIESLAKYQDKTRLSKFKNKKDYLSLSEIESEYWSSSRIKFKSIFDFDVEFITNLIEDTWQIPPNAKYATLHIRRGDYLEVASRVITMENYRNLILRIGDLLPKYLILISDSEIEESELRNLQEVLPDDVELLIWDDPSADPFILHCIMRLADLLITGNSTFSFSAALLGKNDQTVFSPVDFHSGPGAEVYNRTYRSIGGFQVWPPLLEKREES